MMDEHGWRLNSKCAKELSPEQSDALFFPGTGGKPHKAEKFCSTCPFKGQCLQDAIQFKLKGFFAGTTEEQRRAMAFMHNMRARELEMPPEPDPTERKIYLKVFSPDDTHAWLDENFEPDPEELQTVA